MLKLIFSNGKNIVEVFICDFICEIILVHKTSLKSISLPKSIETC